MASVSLMSRRSQQTPGVADALHGEHGILTPVEGEYRWARLGAAGRVLLDGCRAHSIGERWVRDCKAAATGRV
jgi:hypothetical protein